MKLLFITLCDIRNIDSHDIYSDLMRSFAKDGHEVFIVSPVERRNKKPTSLIEDVNSSDWHKNVHILKVKTGNIQKTNFIEKGISTILIEGQIKKGIKKYFKNDNFDLVLYSTPPITIYKPIKYLKKKCSCKTYLLLKDIFPQNALDLGILSKKGLKGILYREFRNKETKLYNISDKIGCMSPANVKFVLEHNKQLMKENVEVCPNSVEILDVSLTKTEKEEMRNKYGIPLNKRVFIYGGNLGRPQDIPFIIDCIKSQKANSDAFFVVVGDGTDYSKMLAFSKEEPQDNFLLIRRLPKEDFDKLVSSSDVGLIFLDHRFTIPNYPSRLLSYLQAKLPILVCTDNNCDMGRIAEANNFGWKCSSDDLSSFCKAINKALSSDLGVLGENGYKFLVNNYEVKQTMNIILNAFDKKGDNL